MAFEKLSESLTKLVGSLRGHRRSPATEEIWRRLESGLLVPYGSSARAQQTQTQTLAEGKEQAIQLEAIFARAGLTISPDSHLGSLLQFAKAIADEYAISEDGISWADIFRAMVAKRVCDAVLSADGKLSVDQLKKLRQGRLDLLARSGPSVAKDFLWELEMLSAFKSRSIAAHLDEPDVVARIGDFSLGVACKKTYSEKGVEKTLSQGVAQLSEKQFDIGIVAFNLDELIVHDSILQTRTRREAWITLNDICVDFLQTNDRLFRKYLGQNRLAAAVVSVAVINETVDEKPSLNNARQFAFWSFPGSAAAQSGALLAMQEAFAL